MKIHRTLFVVHQTQCIKRTLTLHSLFIANYALYAIVMIVIEVRARMSNYTPHTSMNVITYRKLSNISRTKSQNLNDSRLVLHLSSPNLLKPGVKYSMKM